MIENDNLLPQQLKTITVQVTTEDYHRLWALKGQSGATLRYLVTRAIRLLFEEVRRAGRG